MSAAIPSRRPIAPTVFGSSPDTIFTSMPRARRPSTVAWASGRSSSTNVRSASGSSGPGSDGGVAVRQRVVSRSRGRRPGRAGPSRPSSAARARTSVAGARHRRREDRRRAEHERAARRRGWAPSPASKRIADQRSADENGTSATIGRASSVERGSKRGGRVVRRRRARRDRGDGRRRARVRSRRAPIGSSAPNAILWVVERPRLVGAERVDPADGLDRSSAAGPARRGARSGAPRRRRSRSASAPDPGAPA